MRLVVLDIGSHSVKGLLASGEPGRTPVPLEERGVVTRLAEGAAASGMLAESAMARSIDACRDILGAFAQPAPDRVAAVATSAVRDARNREDFLRALHGALGVRPRVLDGAEEARLTFLGATAALERTGAEDAVVVVDVGGGSAELAYGSPDAMAGCASVNAGCVRLADAFHTYGAFPAETADAVASHAASLAAAACAEARAWLAGRRPLALCSGGTATTFASVSLALPRFDRRAIHGMAAARDVLRSLAVRMGAMDVDSRRALPGMEPARAPVLPTGMLVLAALLESLGAAEFRVTCDGLRMGVARAALADAFPPP